MGLRERRKAAGLSQGRARWAVGRGAAAGVVLGVGRAAQAALLDEVLGAAPEAGALGAAAGGNRDWTLILWRRLVVRRGRRGPGRGAGGWIGRTRGCSGWGPRTPG